MFRVFISRRAERDFRSVPKREHSGIFGAVESLKTTYFPDNHDVKKLKGRDNSYRIRVGDWRIIYRVNFDTKEIVVGAILPRKFAYKKR